MSDISRKSRIGSAVADRDWSLVVGILQDRFECRIEIDRLIDRLEADTDVILKSSIEDVFGDNWSNSTWLIWLKNRVVFQHGHGNEDSPGCFPFNFFFITIPEDLKMLGRLLESPVSYEIPLSRSRTSSTTIKRIVPIDPTAGLVVKGSRNGRF